MPLSPVFRLPSRLLSPPEPGSTRTWFHLAHLLGSSATFRRLFRAMAVVGLYAALVVYLLRDYWHYQPQVTVALHSILGITLGLLLVIRSNSAYDRWWEGRKLAGSLLNNCRLLALKVDALLPGAQHEAVRHDLAAYIASYAAALRDHLRDEASPARLPDLAAATQQELGSAHHLVNRIGQRMHRRLATLRQEGALSAEAFLTLDVPLSNLTDILGGCERIRRSPLPAAYSAHLKLFIMVYVLTLPIGLVETFSYYAAPAAMLVFYAMAGLELIAEEIEEPFGTDANDIPMDRIVDNIRHNVYEILVPEALAPKPVNMAPAVAAT